MEIKDSGSRREFASGAVRDVEEGKGRCDLLPLEIVSGLLKFMDASPDGFGGLQPLDYICLFMQAPHDLKSDQDLIFHAIAAFCTEHGWEIPTAVLEVAIHMAEGSAKYGSRNWEKGIPCHCYLDSGVRHYLKWYRGDDDEPHDRAFVWNLLCLLWTLKNRPECNDIWEIDDGAGG